MVLCILLRGCSPPRDRYFFSASPYHRAFIAKSSGSIAASPLRMQYSDTCFCCSIILIFRRPIAASQTYRRQRLPRIRSSFRKFSDTRWAMAFSSSIRAGRSCSPLSALRHDNAPGRRSIGAISKPPGFIHYFSRSSVWRNSGMIFFSPPPFGEYHGSNAVI